MVVPLVVASMLDDLRVGDGRIRPDAESGYKACQAATLDLSRRGVLALGPELRSAPEATTAASG